MNDRTRRDLLEESNGTMKNLITWFAFLVISLLIYAFSYKAMPKTGAVILISIIAISLFVAVLMAFKYARLNGMMNEEEDPSSNGADTLHKSQAEHREPVIKLELRADNLIKLGRYEFTRAEWVRIHNVLKAARWHWNRKTIGDADVIKSITAPGVFPKFQEDMIRLRILDLERRLITPAGRAILRDAAGIKVVTTWPPSSS